MGSSKAMVLIFVEDGALCIGKGLKMVFILIFHGISSFFSIRSFIVCLKARQMVVLWLGVW